MNAIATAMIIGLLSGQVGSTERFPRDQFATIPLGEVSSLHDWIARQPNAQSDNVRSAWLALCEAEARIGNYSRAREACQTAADLKTSAGLSETIAVWASLSETPPISVTGTVDVPLAAGFANLAEINVRIGDQTEGWVLDTGAEISVMSASDAQRLNLRMLDGAHVATGSTPGVASGRLGVIDSLAIGDAVVRHVPVFVTPDEALVIPGIGRLPPVLGMPVLYAFGAARFSGSASRVQLGGLDRVIVGSPMRWGASGVNLELRVGRETVTLHLDSGASQSEFLASDVLPLLPASLRRRAMRTVVSSTGLTGTVRTTVSEVENLPIMLGQSICRIPEALFGEDSSGVQGRLGIDFIRACGDLTLDFITMRASAGPFAPNPRTPPPASADH